ncbi:NAD-dependent epimerase/dehydratase family protein [Nonomuraea gerenzanensis]|uniref:NAD-dependent epimerase/dehydratase family protein n=1 Tax=Nonomuraea gerenzanensis TaxID=93944 RepID=UPI001CD9CA20|nr:NAD(P)-dependent oxidoreductase [Nonomuraea gerenzanensis]UBU19222.1 NAD(P)-dependent oxidoreductase [Nonomuraea gerenzanensis]
MQAPLAVIGSGFLRSALLQQLAVCSPGSTVRVLSPVVPEQVPGLRLEYVRGHITDQDALYAAVTGAETVIHLGTETTVPHRRHRGAGLYTINARGTAALTSAAITKDCRHLIYCSGAEVYGDGPGRLLDEDDPLAPQSRAARAKIVGERIVEQFGLLPGKATTVIRPFGVYGPGQPGRSVFGKIMSAALSGRPIVLPDGGTQLRNFTYVDDVAQGIIAAMRRTNEATAPRACYNIASVETVSIRDAALLAIDLIGSASVVTAPRPSSRRKPQDRPVAVQIPSTERAFTELGFRPLTLLTEGLSRCFMHSRVQAPGRALAYA